MLGWLEVAGGHPPCPTKQTPPTGQTLPSLPLPHRGPADQSPCARGLTQTASRSSSDSIHPRPQHAVGKAGRLPEHSPAPLTDAQQMAATRDSPGRKRGQNGDCDAARDFCLYCHRSSLGNASRCVWRSSECASRSTRVNDPDIFFHIFICHNMKGYHRFTELCNDSCLSWGRRSWAAYWA